MALTGLHDWKNQMPKITFHIALTSKPHFNFKMIVHGSNWIASWACTRPCKLVHEMSKLSNFSSVQISVPIAINTGPGSSIQTHLACQLCPPIETLTIQRKTWEFSTWKLSLNLTIWRFKNSRIQSFVPLPGLSYKLLKCDQIKIEASKIHFYTTLKVNFRKLHIFDSHSILINFLGSLVIWSPTNVGKKIELLWGQIEATQLSHLKILLLIFFYIFGVSWNWGHIRALRHFFFQIMSSFFILVMVEGGPVRWGPPEKKAGALALAVCWHVSRP